MALVLAALAAASCGGSAPGEAEDVFRVPRGATVSVRIGEPLSPQTHPAGRAFRAALDAPLEKGTLIVVPAGARVEGVVEETPRDDDGRPGLRLRLVRLYLDEERSVELQTDPVTRFARQTAAVATNVNALMGLEDKIAYLAETGGGAATNEAEGAAAAAEPLVPLSSMMVFTLSADLVVPLPER